MTSSSDLSMNQEHVIKHELQVTEIIGQMWQTLLTELGKMQMHLAFNKKTYIYQYLW